MTDAISVAGIDSSLLDYYSKLRDHRCLITEGIRVVAFRNMDHLDAAMRHVGVTRFSDEASIDKVQDKMLADQGLEQTPIQRWLLEGATWVPWEIYGCLLYAEIENYKAISRKHVSLVYAPMEEYLESHDALVRSLRDVRDTLLHPLKEESYEHNLHSFMQGAKANAQSFVVAIVEAQIIIDDYLQWLRESFIESVVDETYALSDEQLLEHSRKVIEGLTDLLQKSVDHEEQQAIERRLEGERELRDFLLEECDPCAVLTPRQQKNLAEWEAKFQLLMQPLPKRPYELNPAHIQTPVHEELSSFLSVPEGDGQPTSTGEVLPEVLRRKRSECIGQIVRSIILFNEPFAYAAMELRPLMRDMTRADVLGLNVEELARLMQRVRPIETAEDHRRAELLGSLQIVAHALLAEPLRLYKQVTSYRHDLRRQEIEQRIGGDAVETFLRFRNTVFHVPDDRTDFLQADLELQGKALSLTDGQEVTGGLLSFYLTGPNAT